MEIINDLAKGQPFVILILIIAVVTLWRELKSERDGRIQALTTTLQLGNSVVVALDNLTDKVDAVVRGGRNG